MGEKLDGAAGSPAGAQADDGAAKVAADAAAKATADAAAKTAAEQAAVAGTDGKPGSKADLAKPESKAPEKYVLTVPTGGERFIMAPDLTYIEEVARANGWSNEDAQAEIVEAVARSQARETLQGTAFLEAAKADPEYGGAKFDETQQHAQRAIDRLRPAGHARRDGFLAVLDRGGARNHPEVLAFLADLGSQMSEDRPPRSRAERAGEKTPSEVLYDHPDSQKLAGR